MNREPPCRSTHLEQGVERDYHLEPGPNFSHVRRRRHRRRRPAAITGAKRRGFKKAVSALNSSVKAPKPAPQAVDASLRRKRCPACTAELPLTTSFHRDTSSADGHAGHCKGCRNRADRNKTRGVVRGVEPITGAIPPAVYGPRPCNLCDREYVGIGRLLCDRCRLDIEDLAPMATGAAA